MSSCTGTATITYTKAPDDPREKPTHRSVLEGDRNGMALLHQVGRNDAASHDPEATEEIADRDDRQGRQHADERPSEQDWLGFIRSQYVLPVPIQARGPVRWVGLVAIAGPMASSQS